MSVYAILNAEFPEGKPPRQLSCEVNDPHYNEYAIHNIKLTFNGIPQSMVNQYDANEGWIERYIMGESGNYLMNEDKTEFLIERVHGSIELSWIKE